MIKIDEYALLLSLFEGIEMSKYTYMFLNISICKNMANVFKVVSFNSLHPSVCG